MFYESTAAQLEAVAAYIDYGLRTGHRCLYLTDVNAREEIRAALRGAEVDVDVDRRLGAGDLRILDASEVYLDGGFDPERMIGTIRTESRDSVAEGYEGLWLAGENSWCFHAEVPFDRVIDFEAEFDAACPDLPVTALCQYGVERFEETSAAKALWTHKQVLYRNAVCENPFYIPPEEYREDTDPATNVRLMLEQGYSLAEAARQVERREQRLSVLNRVLRHNVRNDLNVVHGTLCQLADGDQDDGDARRVATALEYVEDVVETADKARYVQRTTAEAGVERVDLGPAIEAAVDDVRAAHPEADVAVSGDREVTVLADPDIDVAVREALTNGVVHQDRESPRVSLAVSAADPDTVRIDVWNPGSIPDPELRTVRRGHETQLEHGSGIGLWLITWLVENSHGTVRFPDGRDGHTWIRIELRRAPG